MINKKSKKWQTKLVTASAVALLVFANTYHAVDAVSGNITLRNIPLLGDYSIPAEVNINRGMTAQQTVLNQQILEARNFDVTDKVKQAVVASPATGGEFKFNATFNIRQSTNFILFSMWDILTKVPASNIASWTGKESTNQMFSYIDLEVNLDERLEFTDSTGKITGAYFDSYTWRPVFVLSADKQTVLSDIRASYNASGAQKGRVKTFDIETGGAKSFVIRVVPIAGVSFTNAELDTDMKFGFDTAGTNNFYVSETTANNIAQARRDMSEDDIANEKAILSRSLNNNSLTEQEVLTLRANNIYVYGEVTGHVQASAFGRTVAAPITKGSFPTAGIAVTYANPTIEFKYNYKPENEDLYKRVYVDYNSTVAGDTLTTYSIPEQPTREGFKFVGWSTDKNATAETISNTEFDVSKVITRNEVVYAIWEQSYKATASFVAENGGVLPQGVNDQLPTERTGFANQANVSAPDSTGFTAVDTTEGTWTFVNWNNASQTVNNGDVTFVGTWRFTPKVVPVMTYKASYRFNAVNGQMLPTEVTDQLPIEQTGIANQTEVTAPIGFTAVETAGGTWTFGSWNNVSQTVNNSDLVFVGTWNFAPKMKTTEFVDEDGNELKETIFSVEVVAASDIDGYYFVETQDTETGVKHIYVKKETAIPDAIIEEKPSIKTTEFGDETGQTLKPVVFAENIVQPVDIASYRFVRTEDTATGVKHVYAKKSQAHTDQTPPQDKKFVDKKESQLPETGQVNTIGYGVSSILGAIGMLFARRSKKKK